MQSAAVTTIQCQKNLKTYGRTMVKVYQGGNEGTSIKDIMEQCELDSKALSVIEQLEFFLLTNEDREKFSQEYEARELFDKLNKGLEMIKLAKELGSYHYEKASIEELMDMTEKEALERLFVEPINMGKLARVKEHAVKVGETFTDGLKKLYNIKIHNPQKTVMESLLFV